MKLARRTGQKREIAVSLLGCSSVLPAVNQICSPSLVENFSLASSTCTACQTCRVSKDAGGSSVSGLTVGSRFRTRAVTTMPSSSVALVPVPGASRIENVGKATAAKSVCESDIGHTKSARAESLNIVSAPLVSSAESSCTSFIKEAASSTTFSLPSPSSVRARRFHSFAPNSIPLLTRASVDKSRSFDISSCA